MFWNVIMLTVAVFTCSTAVVMIKACRMDAILLSAVRLLVATVVLAPLFVRDLRANRSSFTRRHLLRSIVPGLILGGHFITWIMGARLTLAANASLIVNLVPVVMPFLLYIMVREKLTGWEFIGTVISLGGVALLVGADYHLGAEHIAGDVWCFIAMLLLAWYLTLGRRNSDFPTIWLYVTPLYLFGGIICLAAWAIFGGKWIKPTVNDWALAAGLGLIPTVIGHSLCNYLMKRLRGQVVGIANLGQFIFGGLLAFLLLGEVPDWTFYIASIGVVAGSVIALCFGPASIAQAEAENIP